jgi:hypothetical protein
MFNHSEDDKRTWNQQEPSKNRELFDKFAQPLEHARHPSDQATARAGSLLPDVLTYDSSSSER